MDQPFELDLDALEEQLRKDALPAVTVDLRILAPEKVDRSRTVLMDMHSLHVAIHIFLGREVPSTASGKDDYDYTPILANVVQSLVLYESIVVDSLLFETYPELWESYSLFPGIVRALYIPHKTRYEVGTRVDRVTQAVERFDDVPPGMTREAWSALYIEGGIEKALIDQIQRCRPRLVPPEYEWDEDANRLVRHGSDIYLPPCVRHSSLTLPRAHFYLELSREIGLPLAVDPARSQYFKVLVGALEENLRRGLPEKIIGRFEELTLKPGIDLLQGIVSVDLSIPPVADYIFRYSKKKNCNLIDATLELRNSRHAQDFRNWCGHFVALANDGRGGAKEQSELLAELQEVCEVWRKNINEDVDYKTRTLNLEKIPWHIGDVLKAVNMQDVKIKDPIISPAKRNSYFLFLNDLLRPIS